MKRRRKVPYAWRHRRIPARAFYPAPSRYARGGRGRYPAGRMRRVRRRRPLVDLRQEAERQASLYYLYVSRRGKAISAKRAARELGVGVTQTRRHLAALREAFKDSGILFVTKKQRTRIQFQTPSQEKQAFEDYQVQLREEERRSEEEGRKEIERMERDHVLEECHPSPCLDTIEDYYLLRYKSEQSLRNIIFAKGANNAGLYSSQWEHVIEHVRMKAEGFT